MFQGLFETFLGKRNDLPCLRTLCILWIVSLWNQLRLRKLVSQDLFKLRLAVFVDSSGVRIASQLTKKSLRIVGAHLLQAQDLLRELEARVL